MTGNETICGLPTRDGAWWILTDCFDGVATCKDCLEMFQQECLNRALKRTPELSG